MEVESTKLDISATTPTAPQLEPFEDSGSVSESSSEDEGMGRESLDSDGSGPDSSEHHNDEWSDSESSLASASSGARSLADNLIPALLPAASVKAMAESVGCILPNNSLAALGQLAMNKLRRVVMMANQLRKHDQSQGLSVDHFSMAEKLVGPGSYGHKTRNAFPNFKHVGKGITVLDETINVDLLETFAESRKHPPSLVSLLTLSLSHHQLPTATLVTPLDETLHKVVPVPFDVQIPNAQSEDPPQLHISEVDQVPDMSGSNSFYAVSDTNAIKDEPGDAGASDVGLKTSSDFLLHPESVTSPVEYPSLLKTATKLEKLVEKILVLNEEESVEVDTTQEENEGATTSSDFVVNEIQPCVVVGIEWIDYMKVFVASFFYRGGDSELVAPVNKSPLVQTEEPESNVKKTKKLIPCSTDFQLLIDDMTSNGIFPVLGIILDFFHDYMHHKFGESDTEGLGRVLVVIEATLRCSVRTDKLYLHKIWKTVIDLISLPLSIELHEKIEQILVLLLQNDDKEFAVKITVWTGEFITDCFNSVLTSCLHLLTFSQLLLNLALSLCTALEKTGIHLILALNWHTSVLEVLQALELLRSQPIPSVSTEVKVTCTSDTELMKTNEMPLPSPRDLSEKTHESRSISVESSASGFQSTPGLEEKLMTFLRLLLTNYADSLAADDVLKIHRIALDVFGEKMVPYFNLTTNLFSNSCTVPRKKQKQNSSSKNRSNMIRKVDWKLRKVIVGRRARGRK